MEAWHFNYLGGDPGKYMAHVDPNDHSTWASAAEARILERYSADFALSPVQIQSTLAQLKMYNGELDGKLASGLCREAVMAFQRAWDLDVDGDPGIMTQRTMAFVIATIQASPLAPLVA